MTQSPVLFEKIAAGSGQNIAVVTLNNPNALNALSLPMIELLQSQLDCWRADNSVVCVFLQGSGDRAFCAGGDVVSLHSHAAGYGETLASNYGKRFFTAEYRLDYTIHRYPKPIVVWGSGIVMGGGIGLLAGASHRIVTETSRLAMPECAIGLYPDVGASWFLNRMPGASGRFLAFTGISFNAADAKYLGLADSFADSNHKDELLAALREMAWSGDSDIDRAGLTELLSRYEKRCLASIPRGRIEFSQTWIDRHVSGSLQDAVAAIKEYQGDDQLFSKAARLIDKGCPASLYLADEQLRRSRDLSLPEVFRQELIVSTNCTALGHFKEGVRALLIDKDQQPCWQPAKFNEVSAQHIEAFFQLPWEGEHPLNDLV